VECLADVNTRLSYYYVFSVHNDEAQAPVHSHVLVVQHDTFICLRRPADSSSVFIYVFTTACLKEKNDLVFGESVCIPLLLAI